MKFAMLVRLNGRGAEGLVRGPLTFDVLHRDLLAKITPGEIFATMGRYDYIAMFDAEDADVAFQVSLYMAATGDMSTETMPAFSTGDVVEAFHIVQPLHRTLADGPTPAGPAQGAPTS
jgi:uncharacterized protein with GYD domain